MPDKKYKGSQGKPKQNANKKPPLTHFLCFPLVNQSSATQLVDSLAEFKSRIPLITPPAAARAEAAGHTVRVSLVPDDALRPLGTLHLTLGVMSLPTKERLEEALDFLQSLDLNAMLKEAEVDAASAEPAGDNIGSEGSNQPLTITLSSLHALPRTRTATILHAQPIDPSSRLYPLGVKLRNKFIEAGFMHCEMIKDPKGNKRPQGEMSQPQSSNVGETASQGDGDSDGGIALPMTSGNTESIAPGPEGMVPRPLLLHATIANTVYAKGRTTYSAKGKKRKEIAKLDATELIAMFGEPRENQGETRQPLPSKAIPRSMAAETRKSEDLEGGGYGKQPQRQQRVTARGPFIWAKDIHLDRLCICEMGAKPVPYDESKGGPVLGQEYRVIGERRL